MPKKRIFLLGWVNDALWLQSLAHGPDFDHIYVLCTDAAQYRQHWEIFGSSDKITFVDQFKSVPRFVGHRFAKGDEATLVLLTETEALEATQQALKQELEYLSVKVKISSRNEVPSSFKAPFVIATASNGAYTRWLEQLVRSALSFSYPVDIYDLGELHVGQTYVPETQLAHGGYGSVEGKWQSKALHKPGVVAEALARNQQFTVYLDADTSLLAPIDEVVGDYDIGVTIRDDDEIEENRASGVFDFTGYINAGVLFFNHTPAALTFVEEWKKRCLECKNDQKALNQLINPGSLPLKAGLSFTQSGCRVRTFPSEIYNYHYKRRVPLSGSEKIVHFKSRWENVIHFTRAALERLQRAALDVKPVRAKR